MSSIRNISLFSVLIVLTFSSTFGQSTPRLPLQYEKLVPLHETLPPPKPGDWLAQHEEPGQTFAEYRKTKYVKAVPKRKTLYIQVLGKMTKKQEEIIGITKDYMEIYFGLSVKMLPMLPVDNFPKNAQRNHPDWGNHQLLTGYILEKVLHPRLPKDACAMIAFTAHDLYPGEGWNFAFGYTAYQARVGVWSIYRNGVPTENEAAYSLCLKRTLRLATHETLHMFSMLHCTQYRCNLNGVNHLAEADATPLWLCPECLGKLKLATNIDLRKRFDTLTAFHEKHGFTEEAEFYKKTKAAFENR